jgi:voltage-gated potassium channel
MVPTWFSELRYSLLLLAMVIVFVLHPVLKGFVLGNILFDLLFTLVFLATFLILFNQKGRRIAALLLAPPTVIANWTGYVLPGLPQLPLSLSFHLFAALFLGFAVYTILQNVHESRTITTDSLAGAFGGYLLIGVVFSHLYSAVDLVIPGSFHVSPELLTQLQDREQRRMLLNYFSFITLTTVGYGDVTPATQAARSLACLEAVVGQFYIAVVMAELIGLKVSQPRGEQTSGPSPPA